VPWAVSIRSAREFVVRSWSDVGVADVVAVSVVVDEDVAFCMTLIWWYNICVGWEL